MNASVRQSLLKFIFSIFAFLLASGRTTFLLADSDQFSEPLYQNEGGEEIFGAEYRPKSPNVPSKPLLVGAPNAGAHVPDELLGAEQSSLIPRFDSLSVPGESRELWRDSRIPYRRSFTDENSQFLPQSALPSDISVSGNDAEVPISAALDTDNAPKMTVHYIFVGQGDATILEFPCGVAVIDTGGEFGNQGQLDGGQMFIDYLTSFFEARPQLNNTIDVVFTTHPHADHLKGLSLLAEEKNGTPLFTIKNVVDNGQTGDRGSLGAQTTFRNIVVSRGGEYSAVELARQVTATGATNSVIDPITCENSDPIITVFWGGINEALPSDESISNSPYRNPNNHSVIVRVDFGEASFLFTGDLEDRAESDLRQQYKDNLDVFNVDVYQVSHHGADNDTSDDFLEAMSPNIGVISMGKPDAHLKFTAWDHGHPRIGLLSVLQDEPAIILDERDPPEEFLAAKVQEGQFFPSLIKRAIYGTGWEGTVLIEASTDGKYRVSTL